MLHKHLQTLINNNIATFILDKKRKENVKIRYEYKKDNKTINLFLYFNNWNNFINFYNKIPQEHKHFYEIIENECKFFIDLDGKIDEIDEKTWYNNVGKIKAITKKILYEITNKEPIILEFESLYNSNERKYSCHLIVSNIRLHINQCKILCKMISDSFNENNKIIDISVYNTWRSLRLEGSSKINSTRIKRLKDKGNIVITNNIYVAGIVTNLEKTSSINLLKFDSNILNIEKKKKNNDLKLHHFSNIKKYYYDNNDIIFIKKNYKKIELFINKWHGELNTFNTYKITNNMILYKRNKPSKCKLCGGNHENQNPYVFSKYNDVFFDCRRSNLRPIKITDLYLNFSDLLIES